MRHITDTTMRRNPFSCILCIKLPANSFGNDARIHHNPLFLRDKSLKSVPLESDPFHLVFRFLQRQAPSQRTGPTHPGCGVLRAGHHWIGGLKPVTDFTYATVQVSGSISVSTFLKSWNLYSAERQLTFGMHEKVNCTGLTTEAHNVPSIFSVSNIPVLYHPGSFFIAPLTIYTINQCPLFTWDVA